MKLTVSQIAELTGGAVRGDGATVIEGAAGLGEATARDITFLGNAKYRSQLETTKAGAVLVSPEVETGSLPAVVVKNPPYGWARVLEVLEKDRTRRPAGVHPTAQVAPTARVGKNVTIGAFTVVEEGAVIGDNSVLYAHVYVGFDVRIGRDCLIYPRATLRERVTLGDRVILQPGAVIGCDGFGFTVHEGKHYKIPQVGTVEIGDDVEIQANTTIDRAAVGVTKIGRGTKIDNLVQIAHNTEIGEHCLIVALTGIAGSVKIGRYVTLAAQVGVAGHLSIADGVIVAARGGVTQSLKTPKEVLWGLPAQPIRDELKCQAALRRLPAVLEEWREFKKKGNPPA